MSDRNVKVIEEFRNNGGKVGGPFEGAPLLLLHHTGAKSGTARVTPLRYQDTGKGKVVFASKAGHHAHPHWYLNIKANPMVTVEIGEDTVKMKAREALGEERETLWARQKIVAPQFAEYERQTARQIPAIVLEPV